MGWSEEQIDICVPPNVRCIQLASNDLGGDLAKDVLEARTTNTGGYLYPNLPHFPVVNSIYVPPRRGDAIFFLTKTGQSSASGISLEHAPELLHIVPGKLVIVVPHPDLMTQMMPDGPDHLDQYVLVLHERRLSITF
jgi:hypothetical protein